MAAKINYKLLRWMLPLGLVCGVGGCRQTVRPVPTRHYAFVPAVPATPAARAAAADIALASRIAAADNRFGLRLFEALCKTKGDKNVCVSPLSVALALQMACNGASGATQAAMSKTLELDGMTLDDVNKSNTALLNALPASEQIQPNTKTRTAAPQEYAPPPPPSLDIANSLWLRDARAIHPDFMQQTQKHYKAQVSDLQNAPDSINAWVKLRTHGKIGQIIGADDVQNAIAVLVNAVYFKAAWEKSFDTLPGDRLFHLANGAIRTSKMMSLKADYGYYVDDTLQIVSLPYHESKLDMVLVLPNAQTNLNEFVSRITPDEWQKWTGQMSWGEGTVEMPRFRVEYGVDCTGALAVLGMGEAFGPRADFGAMSRSPLFISKVMHKTYMDVDEKGTEAAAAATMEMLAMSETFSVKKPFKITLDRPFLYAIRDRQTGALLFIGTLADPG